MTDPGITAPAPTAPRWIQIAAVLYGLPFVWVGLLHFIQPEVFEPIVPSYLGWPWFWVHITGYTEMGLGIGIMMPRFRRWAGWLMVVKLALLYLANLNMWTSDIAFQGMRMGTTWHLIRLGVQVLLMAAAAGLARSAPRRVRSDGSGGGPGASAV